MVSQDFYVPFSIQTKRHHHSVSVHENDKTWDRWQWGITKYCVLLGPNFESPLVWSKNSSDLQQSSFHLPEFPVMKISREKCETLNPLISLIIWFFRPIIFPFKHNNFSVFSLLKTETVVSNYSVPDESG